jgi:hypothetical protein
MMLQEISAWLSFNIEPPASELKKMKNDIDKLLETKHNSDYKKCSKVIFDTLFYNHDYSFIDKIECIIKKHF